MGLLDFGLIEGRAQWVRKECGLLEADPPYSTTIITERFWPHVPITGANLPNGVTEMVVRDGRRTQLYYSRKVGAPSQRLGILHGCYHLLSDLAETEGIRECNLSDRKFRQRAALESPIEIACDLFAGAVLVPFDTLDAAAPDDLFPSDSVARRAFDDECDRLASRFGVPAGFIRWRLVDLAKLRQSHFFIRE